MKINLLATIIYILSIYRSPTGNLMHFINDTDTILNHISKSNIEVIMCGQLNVNYLADKCNKHQQLENLLATYNLISAVQFATRIISRTNSAVDNNTFVDISHIRKYTACLFIKDLSDHDTQIIKLQNTLTQNKLSETKIIRKFAKYSINYCKIKLSHETWNNLFNENNDKMLKNSHKTYLRFFI